MHLLLAFLIWPAMVLSFKLIHWLEKPRKPTQREMDAWNEEARERRKRYPL